MQAATMSRQNTIRLIALLVILGACLTTTRIISAAPIVDPIDGVVSNVSFDRENGIYTVDLTVSDVTSSVYLEFTEEMTPSFDLVDGHVDVYTETYLDDDGTISQGNRYYRFWNFATPKHAVMLAVAGQTGDSIFDNAWLTLAKDCSILAVIDDVNSSVSPYIHTRLACRMTQSQVENAPEQYSEALLQITPLHTVYVSIVK